MTLLLIQLYGIREVHERFGLVVGDLVLQTVAGRIRSALRAADVISRLDDDQFSVICEDIVPDGDVDRIANRVRAEVTAPLVVEGHRIELAVAIGIATTSAEGNADHLLRDVDAAVTEARRR